MLDSLVLLGVKIVFLPVYSLDFNSVVFVWSKIKVCLCKVEVSAVVVLFVVVLEVLAMITGVDVEGWVKHCGYRL